MIGVQANILIVDDDEVDVMAIRRSLREHNFTKEVYVAKDGIEALNILRDRKILVPYIIIMDINMPRMDGIECMREIRNDKRLRSAPIFVLTTSNDTNDKIKAYEYNPAGYIVKTGIKDNFAETMKMLRSYCHVNELPIYT